MKSCENCQVPCEKAGMAEPACKNHETGKVFVIKTDNVHAFPSRIEVNSNKSGKRIMYTRVDVGTE